MQTLSIRETPRAGAGRIDGDRLLVYRGQFDGSRPKNDISVTGVDLRAAVDAVLAGQPVGEPQTPSIGCNIKWKPDNVPEYVSSSGGTGSAR